MARLKRLVVAGVAHHVVLRSVANVLAFADESDYALFTEALRRSAVEHDVALHAYALLAHEVQLLATPATATSLGRMMQALSRFYVPAFNRRRGRSGALWQGRYRAAPVGTPAHLLACMLYLEQAPERAGHGAAIAYAWSSGPLHAGGRGAGFLAGVPHTSAYWLLGNTPFERDAAYAALLQQPLAAAEVAQVEASTLKGWALGSAEFLAALRTETDRRLQPGVRGRPKRGAAKEKKVAL